MINLSYRNDLTVLLFITVPLLGLTSCSQDNSKEANQQKSDGSTNLTAYIDPDTGELTSTPPDSTAQLPNQMADQDQLPAVEIITHDDGTVQAKLNGRFSTPLVANINCDGEMDIEHIEMKDAAKENCEEEK